MPGMCYQIEVIGDGDLPVGTEWVAARAGGRCYLFVRSGPVPADGLREVERMAAAYPMASMLPTASNA